MIVNTNLTIGSDPELILLNKDGEIIKAGDVLDKKDKFGVDGHAFTAELRPDPAIFPKDLVSNIRSLLATKAKQFHATKWYAGPYVKDKPLGGHIHFGVAFEDKFLAALDNQLAIILALVEPEKQARSRRTVNFYNGKPYGLLGDVRKKPWGFEWRTPSSFITNPGVSLGLFALAKAIIYEEMEQGSNAWSKIKASHRKALTFSAEDFINCNKKVFREKLDLLWPMIQRMTYFQEGQEGHSLLSAISYIKNQVISKEGFYADKDIKTTWGVTNSQIIIEPPNPKKPLVINGAIINIRSVIQWPISTVWDILSV